MANCVMAWPNYLDRQPNPATTGVVSYLIPTFSGGGWAAAFPRTNLQSPFLYLVARSSNATLANTQFDVDFLTDRPQQVFAFVRHNLSLAAKVRFRVATDAGITAVVYDSGWVNVYQPYYAPGTLPWGWSPAGWAGGPTAEDLVDYKSLVFVHVAPQIATGRYLRVEIDDTANGAGYVQLGRCFVGPGYQPQINMSWGAQLGWQTATERETAEGGADFYTRRDGRRRAAFTLENLSEHQAMELIFEMQRALGKDRQLLFVYDPADTYHLHRRSMLATLDELDPITHAAYNSLTAPIVLREVL